MIINKWKEFRVIYNWSYLHLNCQLMTKKPSQTHVKKETTRNAMCFKFSLSLNEHLPIWNIANQCNNGWTNNADSLNVKPEPMINTMLKSNCNYLKYQQARRTSITVAILLTINFLLLNILLSSEWISENSTSLTK